MLPGRERGENGDKLNNGVGYRSAKISASPVLSNVRASHTHHVHTVNVLSKRYVRMSQGQTELVTRMHMNRLSNHRYVQVLAYKAFISLSRSVL
jgi:hypothetical protein